MSPVKNKYVKPCCLQHGSGEEMSSSTLNPIRFLYSTKLTNMTVISKKFPSHSMKFRSFHTPSHALLLSSPHPMDSTLKDPYTTVSPIKNYSLFETISWVCYKALNSISTESSSCLWKPISSKSVL